MAKLKSMSDIEEERKSPAQKLKEKEEREMKNKARIEAIKTWTIVTLVGAILIAVAYFYGVNQGISQEEARNSEVQAKVMELTATIEPESKQ